jgi:hypothetical protein
MGPTQSARGREGEREGEQLRNLQGWVSYVWSLAIATLVAGACQSDPGSRSLPKRVYGRLPKRRCSEQLRNLQGCDYKRLRRFKHQAALDCGALASSGYKDWSVRRPPVPYGDKSNLLLQDRRFSKRPYTSAHTQKGQQMLASNSYLIVCESRAVELLASPSQASASLPLAQRLTTNN